MDLRTKWLIHEHYFLIVGVLFVITVIASVLLFFNQADWKISLPLIGGLMSFIFVVQKQKLDEAHFVNERFLDFNRRYDGLNEVLNEIIRGKGEADLSKGERDVVFDYFNLCGEEFLFYKKGYVYPEVWVAWNLGMKTYFDNARIYSLWVAEKNKESYYGLEGIVKKFKERQ